MTHAHTISKLLSTRRTVAYDRDEGPNAEVTYTLKGSQNSQFYVNSTTGEIFSRKDLSPGELFDVTVSVSDLVRCRLFRGCSCQLH